VELLNGRRFTNPPEMWIRRDNAFKAIIATGLFAKAQEIISQRRRRLSDQEVLDRLFALWRQKGHLSEAIISAAKDVPHSSVYRLLTDSAFRTNDVRVGSKC
jgi:hypothetical protein